MLKNMPNFGLGTWTNKDQDSVNKTIKAAIESDYKLIDTAQVYSNEEEIGIAFKEINLDRENIFITSKLSPKNFKYFARKGTLKSIEKLGLKRLDLMLLHTPMSDEVNAIAYKELMKLREEGFLQHAGVSNFRIDQLESIHKLTGEWPYVNQIALSPIQRPEELEEFCKSKGILLTAYSVMKRYFVPIEEAPNKSLNKEQKMYIDSLCDKYNKDPGQILNKWAIQQGYAVVPKSSNPTRIKSNIKLNDFELSSNEMKYINGWNRFKDSEWIPEQAAWSGKTDEVAFKEGYGLD